MANPLPPPLSDKIANPRSKNAKEGDPDAQEGMCTDTWQRWFGEIVKSVNQAPNRIVAPVSSTTQAAAIGTTTLSPAQPAAGLYRVTWYARITTAAGVSSSLTVTVNYTDHGQAVSLVGTAITGNTVTTVQSLTAMFYSDELTAITYSTAYASNPASAMQYELYVVLEAMFQ